MPHRSPVIRSRSKDLEWPHLAVEIARRTAELRTQVEERALAEKNLRDLTGKLLTLRDDEQRRLARELHDGVGQLLAAMSMNQSIVLRDKSLSEPAQSALTENASLLAQVLAEIRTISYLLHPPLLDEVGLASGIRMYLEGFGDRSKMKVNLELAEDFGRLSRDSETALFRIIQECLTNVHRHSESPTATIRLGRSSDEVFLEIADAGKGMSGKTIHDIENGKASGVGLRGMRERIRQLGGSFKIQSNGNGTVVASRLPCTRI
jgi:signal transduction histidine kinase